MFESVWLPADCRLAGWLDGRPGWLAQVGRFTGWLDVTVSIPDWLVGWSLDVRLPLPAIIQVDGHG